MYPIYLMLLSIYSLQSAKYFRAMNSFMKGMLILMSWLFVFISVVLIVIQIIQ